MTQCSEALYRLQDRGGAVLLILVMLFALSSCATTGSFRDGVLDKKETRYKITVPGNTWRPVRVGGADIAYFNETSKAVLLVHATCEGFRDAPVKALASHLFFGIEEKRVLVREERPMDGRQAVYTELEGMLDGAPVKVAAYTMLKNYCLYDVAYSAPPDSFETDRAQFESIAKSLTTLPRKD